MSETLYDKILKAVHQTIDTNGNGQDEVDCAKACYREAIQAQIVTLKIINQNLELHCENEIKFIESEPMREAKVFSKGKIEGIKLAIENIHQEIQELEKQIS